MNTATVQHNPVDFSAAQLIASWDQLQQESGECIENVACECREDVMEYSVKKLRNLFQRISEGGEQLAVKPALASKEEEPIRPASKATERSIKRLTEIGYTECQPVEAKSVRELKQLFEAKARMQDGSTDKVVAVPNEKPLLDCSEPVTAEMEDRQDTVPAVETPHPEGQYALLEEQTQSRHSCRWYLAHSKLTSVPNGVHISLLLKNDLNRGCCNEDGC